jgi:hypothetical protein
VLAVDSVRQFSLGTGLAIVYPIIVMALGHSGGFVGEAGTKQAWAGTQLERSLMTILDLIKATVVCGAIAFLIYSYPLIGQIVLIGFLSLLWLVYAHKTIAHLRRR